MDSNKDLDLDVEYRRYRQLGGVSRLIVILLSFAAIGIAVYYIFRLSFFGLVFRETGYFYLLIAFLLPLLFLLEPISKKASKEMVPWYDAITAFVAFCIPFYFFLVSAEMADKGWEVAAPGYIKILSLVLLILALEGARRSTGIPFAIVVSIFGCIPLFASHLPEPFSGTTFPCWRIVSFHAMGTESLLGLPMNVVGTLLIGFLIFAVGLMSTGGGTFFFNLALSVLGQFRGGPAKVAVIASSLFGMISGSVVANILVDGGITIPTMKKAGFPAHYAAAVECVASTGGVLMPPVMGAAAFLIAQFLGISYATVAISAFIPSILYYFALFMQIDAFAAKKGLKGLPKESLPSLGKGLKEGWFYIISFVTLIWALFFLKMEGQAPFIGLALLFIISIIRKEGRFTHRDFFKFLERSGGVLCDILAVMLGVGIIIGSLTMTGISAGFSTSISHLAGSSVPLLLGLGAVTSFILGMGMSITACYVLLAVLIAPAMVSAGLDPLAVHLFIMYWGMISYLTPPVAVGAYAAAGIIGANPMRTGYACMRLGLCIYFVPFFFAINPSLILHGPIIDVVISVLTALIGIPPIAWGIEGYAPKVGKVGYLTRIFLIMAGVLLMYPHLVPSIIGAILLAILILVHIKPWQRLSEESVTKQFNE
jgi:TRAP transporter 4TM/12TM fusion protein